MQMFILNFDSIPETLPSNCELIVPEFVERFLYDAEPLNLLIEKESNLLKHIKLSSSSSTTKKTKHGMKIRTYPPKEVLHKRIESQYEAFFNRKTV